MQFVFAPVMVTVPPVGVGPPQKSVTLTVTLTCPFGADGLGEVLKMVIVTDALPTVWDNVPVLALWVLSPAYSAVIVLTPREVKV